jgi:signal transduction histidine kinase
VVDDDASVREGVASLIRSAGLEAKALASGQELLAIPWSEIPSCLVLDVDLPGLSGLDVQQELVRSGVHIPIIFLTGHGDIPMSVRAIQAGAADFLTKPFEGGHLLDVIRRCIGEYHEYNRQPQNQLNDKLMQEKLCLQDEARSAVSFAVRLEERNRIARELHDTLLQTFLGALCHLGVAVESLPPESQVKSKLDPILQVMERGIEEGRNAIEGLRSSDSRPLDLVVALSAVHQEFSAQHGVDFHVRVVGQKQPLRPAIQDEIYRIGREALVNAFCHAAAKRIELELEYIGGGLTMRVRDDGCGMDRQVLDTGRKGHWGLTGMRERAVRIGGLLKISSSPTAGTEIQLSVPSGFRSNSENRQLQVTRFNGHGCDGLPQRKDCGELLERPESVHERKCGTYFGGEGSSPSGHTIANRRATPIPIETSAKR